MRSIPFCLTVLLALFNGTPTAVADDGGDDGSNPSPWEGCVDYLQPDALVEIGKETVICMVLANDYDWQKPLSYVRLNFRPKADEYSRFHVPNSFEQLVLLQDSGVGSLFNGADITVSLQSQKALSFQKRYYERSEDSEQSSKIFPFMTAIIDVEDGVVKGIAWDDACLYCGNDRCEENTFDFNGNQGNSKDFDQPTKSCYYGENKCLEFVSDEKTDCDIVLHVVWTGTDKNGKSFMSSSSRFSAFPHKEVRERYSENLPDYTPPEEVETAQ